VSTADDKCQPYTRNAKQMKQQMVAMCCVKLTMHMHKENGIWQLLKSTVNTLNEFICSFKVAMGYKIFALR